MNKYRDFFKNLFKEDRYLFNIGDVKVVSSTNADSLIKTEDILEEDSTVQSELEVVFLKNKRNNKEEYISALTGTILKKTGVFYLPLFLVLLTIGSYIMPSTVKTKAYDKYYVTDKVIIQDQVVKSDDYNAYYDDSISPSFVDENIKVINNTATNIYFYLQKNGDGNKYTFKVNDSNELTLKSFESAYYLNSYSIDEGKKDEASSLERIDEINDLIDEVINYLLQTSSLGDNQKKEIEELYNEENSNRQIIVEIVSKEYQGKEDIMIYNKHVAIEVISTIVTAIYLIGYLLMLSEGELDFYFDKLKHKNGELYSDDCSNNFFPLSGYRSELIAAEKERIKLSIMTAKGKNVPEEEIKKILTDFEIRIGQEYGYLKKDNNSLKKM